MCRRLARRPRCCSLLINTAPSYLERVFRFDLINRLIDHHGYQRYLEIGVEDGDAVRSVRCSLKHGVDPASRNATFQIPSDEFFAMIHPGVTYDCIFVDGLHTEEQAGRDMEHALSHLADGGTIVVHDLNPPTEWHQRSYEDALLNGCRLWNGTVWRAWVHLRATRSDLAMHVVDIDWGCGVISRGTQTCIDLPQPMTYADFDANRADWLNLISVEDFEESLTRSFAH